MNQTGRAYIAQMVLLHQREANESQLKAMQVELGLEGADGNAAIHRANEAVYSTCAAALLELLSKNYDGEPEPDTLLEATKTALATMTLHLDIPLDVLVKLN